MKFFWPLPLCAFPLAEYAQATGRGMIKLPFPLFCLGFFSFR